MEKGYNYRINKIYSSFMGEVNKYGIGAMCTFIRLAGCNLRCYQKTKGCLCDTPEALKGEDGIFYSIDTLLNILREFGNPIICLTGGEPLLQPLGDLLSELSKNGYHVVIETNGSISISEYRHIRNVSFVVDYKLDSTGEMSRMNLQNFDLMTEDDYLKFVIDSDEDYLFARRWVRAHNTFKGKIAFGLFWGSEISYQELLNKIKFDDLNNVCLNFQTHKMMCVYDQFRNDPELSKILIPKDL